MTNYAWGIEKGLYRRMKAWLDGRRALGQAQALT